ncbi:MAG: ABC transporter ATP-binding protein [Veillonella sp.]|nr:ABC transporter ATP-binding protein [Veillonella sp.]
MIEIVLNNISKSFGSLSLYKDLQYTFRPGRCHFILGHNGSGKSTLLQIISQMALPDKGQVEVYQDGQALKSEDYRQVLGIVSPELQLYSHLTARENIRFLAGMRQNLEDKDIDEVLDRVGLEAVKDKPMGAFSTGMKQRLKFAVLLASGAQVWLLDEPTSNLDDVGKAFVREVVEEALAQGATILWATNETGEVTEDADIFRVDA